MEYSIPGLPYEFHTTEAASLTQRIVPLASLYRNLYILRKSEEMSDNARAEIQASLDELSEAIIRDILRFSRKDPYDIIQHGM